MVAANENFNSIESVFSAMEKQKSVKRILVVVILLGLSAQVFSRFEFTNIKCNAVDKTFMDYDYCYLKSVNRTYKYVSVKIKLFQVPVKNVFINVALQKRLNGYKPFLYNLTIDFCQYIRNPNPGNKVASFFFGLIRPYSNINHTCPYNHDIIIEKVPISFLNHKLTEVLPLPLGDYCISCSMMFHNINRGEVKTYFTTS